MVAGSPKLRERQQRQLRAEIVRAAFDLFGERGFQNVSADEIAAAAGISRATFFNYFPQKELVLQEIAAARAARFRSLFAELAQNRIPAFSDFVDILSRMCAENARIVGTARSLMLEAFFRNLPALRLRNAREMVIATFVEIIERIPHSGRFTTRQIAETFFSVYLATMLEWMIREELSPAWLPRTMRQRGQVVLEGLQ